MLKAFVAGEWAPMDISARSRGMSAIVRRFPIGPVAMISPFNFPLNLTAHKIAPALAVGYDTLKSFFLDDVLKN